MYGYSVALPLKIQKKLFKSVFYNIKFSPVFILVFFIRLTIGPQSDLCKQLAKGTLKGKELNPYSFENCIHTSLYLGKGTVMQKLRQSVKVVRERDRNTDEIPNTRPKTKYYNKVEIRIASTTDDKIRLAEIDESIRGIF